MSINETLIGQMITFGLFVWFTMKFVWPALEKTLNDRREKIEQGLLAAERGHKELELAQKYATEHIHEAKTQALEIVEQAKKQADTIVREAKKQAGVEKEQIVEAGHREVELEWALAQENLQKEIIELTVNSAEKLLDRVMTDQDRKTLAKLNVGDSR